VCCAALRLGNSSLGMEVRHVCFWQHQGGRPLTALNLWVHALGNATRVMRFCWRQLQLVGHARQVRQGRCPHLTHYLATMNFYRDFAYAEVGCDLLV
jgi:hypothetical protein